MDACGRFGLDTGPKRTPEAAWRAGWRRAEECILAGAVPAGGRQTRGKVVARVVVPLDRDLRKTPTEHTSWDRDFTWTDFRDDGVKMRDLRESCYGGVLQGAGVWPVRRDAPGVAGKPSTAGHHEKEGLEIDGAG